MQTPVYSFVAHSGTGKTTYLEGLIPALKARGLRLGIVKHDAHDFDIDHEGKDSWRFARAGADVTAVSSQTKTAVVRQGPPDLAGLMAGMEDMDLILTEGYKHGPWPKILVHRAGTGRPPVLSPGLCAAAVSDEPLDTAAPLFPLDDPGPLADWLAQRCGRRPI